MKIGATLSLFLLATLCTAQDLHKVGSMPAPGPLSFATVCDSGRAVIGINRQKNVFVWDVVSGKSTPLNIKGRRSNDGACAANGPYAAIVASLDGRVLVVDLRDASKVKDFKVTEHIANAAAISPDGKTVVAATDDGPPKLIDVATGTMKTLQTEFGATSNVVFAPDGNLFATADEDTHVRIYTREGKVVTSIAYGRVEPFGLVFSADSKSIFVSGADFSIHHYDAQTGQLLAASEKLENPIFMMSRASERFLGLALDKKSLAPAALYTFNGSDAKPNKLALNPMEFVGAGVSPKGWVLVKSEGESISLWELTAKD